MNMRSKLRRRSVLVALPWLASAIMAPGALGAPRNQTAATAQLADSKGNPLRMWYTTPVSDWENQALVQGNGTTGLMAFGNPGRDRLHFNEKTLWTGGPANGRTYLGGNKATAITPQQLNNYRLALDNKATNVFGLPPTGAAAQPATHQPDVRQHRWNGHVPGLW